MQYKKFKSLVNEFNQKNNNDRITACAILLAYHHLAMHQHCFFYIVIVTGDKKIGRQGPTSNFSRYVEFSFPKDNPHKINFLQ